MEKPTTKSSEINSGKNDWLQQRKADVFAEHLDRNFGPNEEKTLVNARRKVKTQIDHISPIKPKEIIK